MRRIFLLLAIALLNFGVFGQAVTEGSLFARGKKGSDLGACPLKTTSVRADISGFVARVNVRQEFENSFTEAIEAVYTFPLSQNGAVDRMTMTIGDRIIHGKVMKREEARKVYETAKSAGQAASLLDQERPNIFTQSVANIMPGEKIVIEISYVETLSYEGGVYEFVFPMTVGPRYIPGHIADAAKIAPPIAETRAGHDVSIDVNLNAGVPIEEIRSTSHQIDQVNISPSNARVSLHSEKVIPNKDFVFRYDVSGKRIEDAVLAHRGERGGFFTLVLQPPDKIANEDRTPKEIVFVLDTSGSMSGFPIEKAKEAMKLSLDGLYPDDTFNLITFAGDTEILFDEPVPATQANLEKAQAFLESREGGGGTEMMKAIKAALDPSDAKDHLRVVCFMTDGYVGNEEEIIAEVQRHPKARVFSFGIGNSVNRFLLDKMAEAGRGEVEYVALEDDGSKAAKKFYERVRTPLLTDISIDWNGVAVSDVYPSKIGDLFSAKPVIVNGRFMKPASGTIKLKGLVAGMPYERSIAVNLPEAESANDALASLWARRRIDELSSKELNAKAPQKINAQITNLALDFGLMSQFTSFVAVEDKIVNQNGKPTTIQVPVNIPEGVDAEKAGGNFGDPNSKSGAVAYSKGTGSGSGTGVGYGSGSGSGSMQARSMTTTQTVSAAAPVQSGELAKVQVVGTVSETVNVASSVSSTSSSTISATQVDVFKTDNFGKLVPGVLAKDGDGIGDGDPRSKTKGASRMKPISPQKLKLHVWLYQLVQRLSAGATTAGPNEATFVRNGKAEISVTITSPAAIEKLKTLGMEIDPSKSGTNVTGRIAIEKLAALADITEVKLIFPRTF